MSVETTISVVVPTLDRPEDLEICLEHLQDQTCDDFIMLIVDSGTGANEPVIDSFRDSLRIRHHMIPKNGLPRARNISLSMIDTDVVAFCDEDARPVDGWLKEIASEFDRDQTVGAVGGPVLKPDETLQPRKTIARVHDNGEVTDNFDADHRATVKHLRGTNMAFRTDLLRELGGFDPVYRGTAHFEDTDATYKIHQVGYDVVYTPKAIVYHYHADEDRNFRNYYEPMLWNWPVLLEKTDPSMKDRLSFYVRWVVR